MEISINTENVTSTVVAAVILIVITKIGAWLWNWANRLYEKLKAHKDTKVPASLNTAARHFFILTPLVWMLIRTVQLSEPSPSGWNVVLICGWTWAVLTYTLHMWRRQAD